jgi:hypothetical protein
MTLKFLFHEDVLINKGAEVYNGSRHTPCQNPIDPPEKTNISSVTQSKISANDRKEE